MKTIFSTLKRRKELLIIITAALLIELVSVVQHYSTYDLLEEQLEKRAESELTMKAILTRGALNSAEDILENHIWDVQRHLSNPDSMNHVVRRFVEKNRYVCGGFVGFQPNYYPEKGELFEPYARVVSEDCIVMNQIASAQHDYTKYDFYQDVLTTGTPQWAEPYVDREGAMELITSYLMPVRDKDGAVAGVAGVDLSLEWLSDTLQKKHVYPSSFNLLLTEGGEIIVKPSEESVSSSTAEYIAKLINDSTVERKFSCSGRSKMLRFKLDGQKGTVFYASMKGKPHWQIAVVCHDNEVFGALNKLRLFIGLLMLSAFAILLFMIWNFARKERQLNKKNLEQERIGSELRIASGIQQAILNMDDPVLAKTKDLEVWGTLIPAKEVGGDLYNAFIRDDKLFFCIGDVSGKGVPSAIIMAVVNSVFRTIASRENNPSHIMTQLNEMACRNNKENIFVTMFVGVLDLPTGHLRYCNAGHELPVIVRKNGKAQEKTAVECSFLNAKPNLPIGLFDDFKYEMQSMTLQGGSALFLYTDGLTEGRNPKNEQFGRERMMAVLSASTTIDPKRLAEAVVNEQHTFAQSTEQNDDLTLLAISYDPVIDENLLEETLTLQNDVKQVAKLNAFMTDITERLGISKPQTYQLKLALEEAVVNVMEYAYPKDTTGDIHIKATSNGKRLKIIITDMGTAFNPTERATADTTLSVEDRPVGGLGIFLVRELMDSINYERIAGKNVLTMRKDYSREE